MILLEIFPVPGLDDGGEVCRVWFIQSNKIIYPWIKSIMYTLLRSSLT